MKKVGGIKKYLLVGSGFISLALGILGIFLPILPTTPFLILTAFCFIRTSNRLYHWLINDKVVGAYILNYIKYQSITKKAKIIALLWLWGSIGISIYLVSHVHCKLLLIVIAMVVSAHIVSLRSRQYEEVGDEGIRADVSAGG